MLLPMSIRMLINPSRSSSFPRLPNEVPISRLLSLYLSNPLPMLHFEVPNNLPARLAQNPVIISRSVSVIAPNEHQWLRLLYRRAGCRRGRAAPTCRSLADTTSGLCRAALEVRVWTNQERALGVLGPRLR